ncbi:hypothetical protein [Curtobacterium flaccumfaciens]|uniref:hypothetical protein n=1 Tax=Curtobacterium flaccumfaciens TaxID=2035 RepID=UPI001BDF185A|nr:hypothetical protein [Curtobacterium flaccumfaciens]MBT1607799.1 hypothetical protein [Curtobacterium flaccumfaciens pv. betae]MBT1655101.1 hypothetical protein [Curtobacterium flaccumfaciens pv. betae]MCS0469820.1 hypothetical protein [Curtobacterium flaccumfaciens pv. betae]MCS0472986.1 hypothetical protein [Curtobacterium flaccumfaciens pv. betae]MCS0476668.1 hypothetical protein [Curtobacterium flaccumfaciens pv. betae]
MGHLHGLQNRLAILTFDSMPSGWSRATSVFVNVGVSSRLQRAVLTASGMTLDPPADLAEWKAWKDLRVLMSDANHGAWFTGRLQVESSGAYRFDFDWDTEPQWPVQVDLDGNIVQSERVETQQLRDDLQRYPRDAEIAPEWLIQRLAANPLRFVDAWQPALAPLANSENWVIVRDMIRGAIQAGSDDAGVAVEANQVAEVVSSELVGSTRVGQVLRLCREASEGGLIEFRPGSTADAAESTSAAPDNDEVLRVNVEALMAPLVALAGQELLNAR